MTVLAEFYHGNYRAIVFCNDKTGRYGYTIYDAVGNVYARGTGRKTFADANEECHFEIQYV